MKRGTSPTHGMGPGPSIRRWVDMTHFTKEQNIHLPGKSKWLSPPPFLLVKGVTMAFLDETKGVIKSQGRSQWWLPGPFLRKGVTMTHLPGKSAITGKVTTTPWSFPQEGGHNDSPPWEKCNLTPFMDWVDNLTNLSEGVTQTLLNETKEVI